VHLSISQGLISHLIKQAAELNSKKGDYYALFVEVIKVVTKTFSYFICCTLFARISILFGVAQCM
jgi:hypothetical protein